MYIYIHWQHLIDSQIESLCQITALKVRRIPSTKGPTMDKFCGSNCETCNIFHTDISSSSTV